MEGKFISPLELHLPGVVPKAAQEAHFQVILPKKWREEKFKPMCIHLAGTGDHVCIVFGYLQSVSLYKVLCPINKSIDNRGYAYSEFCYTIKYISHSIVKSSFAYKKQI